MTGRLHDRLAQTFGHNKVFMDVGSIPVGEDFVRYINNQVAACDVILVVIGPDWLKVKNNAGKRDSISQTTLLRLRLARRLPATSA